jgi:dipeptidyl aminopeptidase/acylaminoacyl peptidase
VEPVFVRRHDNRQWDLVRIPTPGGPVTRFCAMANGSYSAYQNPRRPYFVFDVDASPGAERIQLIGYDPDSGALVQLTDGLSKNDKPVFSNSGEMMMYSSNRRNLKDMDLYVLNPRDPSSNRMVAQLDGEDWTALDWSPDDRKVIVSNYRMAGETYLWLLDVETGMKTPLTAPHSVVKVFNGSHAQFSADGKGVYHITDRDSEFRRLAYLDIATRRYKYLTSKIRWDVKEFTLSPDRKLLAFVSNENGFSRLHMLDIAKKIKELRVPEMPIGVIDKLRWHNNSKDVGFAFSSETIAGDIGSIDTQSNVLCWWTRNGGLESTRAELIQLKSFDGKLIPGFLYRPPSRFTGRRPVIIDVHGGPNAQFRPSFRGGDNYFTFELGAVMISKYSGLNRLWQDLSGIR